MTINADPSRVEIPASEILGQLQMPAAFVPVRAGRWKHRIGACVDHVKGSMPAIVLARTRTQAGIENYNVRLIDQDDARRDRVIRADYTKKRHAGSNNCAGCRFFIEGKCCRDFS